MSDPTSTDADRRERTRRRRELWQIQPLDDAPAMPGSAVENLARLERLRRTSWEMRGLEFPGPSTREERQNWPWSWIHG